MVRVVVVTEDPVVSEVPTLSIDIGGTGLKAGILNAEGLMIAGPVKVNTPRPSRPDIVISAIVNLVGPLGDFARVSVGFPGVVRGGRTLTAPNLGTDVWHNYPLGEEIARRLGKPVRVLNDASVQGLGVISGVGLECVITLGTGFGFALFEDGLLAPHLEVGQHPIAKDKTYDRYLGNAALREVGRKKWNKRVEKAVSVLDTLVTYDSLLIGGGNAQVIDFDLPPNVRTVPNSAGITGGVKLWSPQLDVIFKERESVGRPPPKGITPAPELP
jgi:polyphosphate glucokinase